MESKVVKSDFTKLNKFLSDLAHADNYVVRVGIFGSKNARPDSKGQTNADIGFIHEFGRPTSKPPIPRRSFLRMPIQAKSELIISELKRAVKAQKPENVTIFKILKQLGFLCERVILDAFETKGFGSWKPNAPSTIRRKAGHTGSTSPLIDFGFLRKSISSEVVSR